MGIILGIAALLDALLVRLMLVPILLRPTGRALGGCRGGSTGSSRTRASGTDGTGVTEELIVRPWMPSS
jgi:hypothetical protein